MEMEGKPGRMAAMSVLPSGRPGPSPPMKKAKTIYVCDACGGKTLRWAGQCPDCGAWNTLTETQSLGSSAARAAEGGGGETVMEGLSQAGERELPRYTTGLEELDRVLGGGLVPGSI